MEREVSTLGKIVCVLVSLACVGFLVFMNANDKTRNQQAAAEVAAVNEDTREAEKEIAEVEEKRKTAALEEKKANDSFYEKLADGLEARVLVLGDAVANGYGASSVDVTWANLLAQSLEEQYNTEVTVDNYSIIDSGAYEAYARVKMLESDDYDLAIIVAGASDESEKMPVYYEALLRAIREKFSKCSTICVREYMEDGDTAKNQSIAELSEAYKARTVDFSGLVAEHPEQFMLDGGYLNDEGNKSLSDLILAQIQDAVNLREGYSEEEIAPIHEDAAMYDEFLYVPKDMFARTGRQYVLEKSFKGIVSFYGNVVPGDNNMDVYVDRVKTQSYTVTNTISVPVEHIQLVEDEVNVSRRIGVIFATEESAEGFQGMCVTVTQ